MGESGAGVGAAHSTEDGVDNKTALEGRGPYLVGVLGGGKRG